MDMIDIILGGKRGGSSGGGLPVINFTTVFEHGATCTEEECAALTSAYKNNLLPMCVFSYSGMTFCIVASSMEAGDDFAFLASNTTNVIYLIQKDGDTWTLVDVS